MSVKSIFSQTVAKGKVALTVFNNYSGVIIRTPSTTLIFDPIDIDVADVDQADIMVITHEHYDHFEAGIATQLQKKTNATVVTTPFVASQLKGVPSNMVKAFRAGDSASIDGVNITAEHSEHPGNKPLTFLVASEDGIKVYHSSDSQPFKDMAKIGEKHKPDVAFCTVGIAPGTSPRSGVEVAKLVKPKVAIPYHTDRSKSLEDFAEILGKEKPDIKTKIIRKFEIYQYP